MQDYHTEECNTFFCNKLKLIQINGGSTMFMDWKSQYCKGVNCLQMDLQIPCNPIKITKGYLTEFSKLTLKCI